jgi:hypothetical protein
VVSQRENSVFTKVHELVDLTSGQWDEQLLNDTFCAQDVRIIRASPAGDALTHFRCQNECCLASVCVGLNVRNRARLYLH